MQFQPTDFPGRKKCQLRRSKNSIKIARDIWIVHSNHPIIQGSAYEWFAEIENGIRNPEYVPALADRLRLTTTIWGNFWKKTTDIQLENWPQRWDATGRSLPTIWSPFGLHKNLKLGYLMNSLNSTRNTNLTLRLNISSGVEGYGTAMTDPYAKLSPSMRSGWKSQIQKKVTPRV